jgi:holliday junction DNA helicase RuvA
MIERLEGDFLEIGADHLLIGVGGVGIRVSVPRSVIDRLDGRARGVVWTRLIVREGDPQLFGFLTLEERACFDALRGVNGVGPRIAMAILSFLDPSTLALELERGSNTRLLTVPGVGRKIADRIVLELKGKIAVGAEPLQVGDGAAAGDLSLDAVRALTALGYPLAESREAVRQALKERADGPATLDAVLREALTGLNRSRR